MAVHFFERSNGKQAECGDEHGLCPECEDRETAYWAAQYRQYGENARLVVMGDSELAAEMASAREVK